MIRIVVLAAGLAAAFSSPSFAQSAQPYTAPDKDLWDIMARALDDLPMSTSVHQQVQSILAGVQREAQVREMTRAAAKKDETSKNQ